MAQQKQQLTQEQLQQQQQEEFYRQEFAYKQRLYNAAKSTFVDLSKSLNEAGGSIFNFMFNTLTASKGGQWPNLEEILEYSALCKQMGLNPLLKSEVTPLVKGGRVSLIIMRDGWRKLARTQPSYNGMSFKFSEETVEHYGKQVPAWCECQIFERGIDHPFTWRTPFNEAVRTSDPWKTEPTNMLQIRSMNRAIRNCYGLAVYDAEEANDFDSDLEIVQPKPQQTALPKKTSSTKAKVQQALAQKAQSLPLKEPEIFEQTLQPEQVPVEQAPQFEIPAEEVEALPFDVEPEPNPSGDAVGYGAMNGKTLNNE